MGHAALDGFDNGRAHNGVVIEINDIARIGANDMRDVTVARTGFFEGQAPLQKATVRSDLRAIDFGEYFLNTLHQRFLHLTQHPGGFHVVVEDLKNQELLDGGSRTESRFLFDSVFIDIEKHVFG